MLLGLMAVMSCSDQAPEPATITGQWVLPLPSGAYIRFTLGEAGGQAVSGSGTYGSANGTEQRATTVNGTYVTPSAALTFSISGLQPISFTGTHQTDTPERITGTLSGSGYSGDAATIRR